jgi:predicted metal-dependent enzyme (double-stranded beta helix superfamily)
MNKLAYKPIGVVAGVVSGAVAGLLFKQIWRMATDQDDAPNATDEHRTWTEILVAAALQGAIFAVVKAAVDRGGAAGVRQLTGKWPTN